MEAVRRAAATLRRGERGFTLIELLVATTAGLVVVGGALTVFIGAVRSEPRTAAKVAAIQQARVTADRITRELRQGLETDTTSTSHLEIVTYVKAVTCGGAPASTAIPCRVTYDCKEGACTRAVAQPDGSASGPAVEVVTGLTTPAVFSYVPPTEPTYVGVTFSLGQPSGSPVRLDDGVALRNAGEEEEP